MQHVEFRAMNCQMLAELDSDLPGAAAALAQVPGWFEEWEQCLSRFRSDSELSRLNQRSSDWVVVSEALWAVIQAAIQGASDSDGLVTPTLLDALEDIGYDRSFDEIATRAIHVRTFRPTTRADWMDIELDASRRAVRLPKGMRLDLGGVAKGWAADEAVRRLAASGPALVDAGGDVAVSGLDAQGGRVPIGVANPFQPDRLLGWLMVEQCGVATSGRDYRRWQFGGALQHHILDPRTRRPAQTRVLSATVIAPTAARAEVAAKTALILGSQEGLAWLNEQPVFAGLLILEGGDMCTTSNLGEPLWCEGDIHATALEQA